MIVRPRTRPFAIRFAPSVPVSMNAPRPWVAGYMGAWGIITALARVVYAGPAGLADCLVRAANGGAPLALWLGWREREGEAGKR